VRVPFLDLSRAVAASRGELEAALGRVLDEARFVLGPPVEAFEWAFADWCGAAHAVGVASGTDALALALRAAGVGPGDEVVTAASTCVPTVAAIEAAGATPVLADVDPVSRTLDPESAAAAITARTRALVPVHLYGRCADMAALRALAAEHGLAVVEDAAQAHGATHGDRRAGTLGDAAAFSFYPTKNLGALGDAGAVVTDDPALADRVRMLRSYGERERYDSVESGTNSRLDTLQAAALLARLPGLDAANERRRRLAARYTEGLAGLGLELPDDAAGGHAFHLYVVAVPERDGFRAALAERGVDTLVHYPRAVHEHPAYGHLARPGELEISERLAREVVSLPLYPELTDAEAEAVVEAVRAAVAGRTRR
jgi:dTDP-3-amino-3,4,6-trideoxy-alpha-D-glucose transaminase